MVKGIPFDSPLYEVDEKRGIEYINCEGITAFFMIKNDITNLLPEGLKPYSEPAQGGIWIAHYPFSTVGEYYEYITVIQVEDTEGDMGYYIPYIYVTNDSALAAGREFVGAPKKLAHIELIKEYDLVQGVLERPRGKRLVTFTLKPTYRASEEFVSAIIPRPTPLLSVRHLPPVMGEAGVTQLVKWYSDIVFYKDSYGEAIIFAGPASITYDSPSIIDPVHNVEIEEILTALYFKFDMKLGVTKVLKEY